MTNEPKPCPLCGGPGGYTNDFVTCERCGIAARREMSALDEVIEACETCAAADWPGGNRDRKWQAIDEARAELLALRRYEIDALNEIKCNRAELARLRATPPPMETAALEEFLESRCEHDNEDLRAAARAELTRLRTTTTTRDAAKDGQ